MKFASLFLAACLLSAVACKKPAATSPTTATTATGGSGAAAPKMGISKLKDLTIKDTKIGDGMVQGILAGNTKPVQNGDTVTIQYTGKLQDGTLFDSNVPGTKINGHVTARSPMVFTVGTGAVVPGMDKGVVGMKIDGEREIGIPPSLGYGPTAMGPIPPNSDLLFTVKLLDDVKPGEDTFFDKKDLALGSGEAVKKGDTIQIEYTVKLVDGTVVDTNVGKDPFEFTIGEQPAKVISGIEQGVIGMKKGGVRLLRIPPSIAYSTKLVQGIPPNSTLIVTAKILNIM